MVVPAELDEARAEEARLVALARRGDADAYGKLVARHQAAAFRVAYLLLGSAPDAEDAAQEAFVKAYLALGRFRFGEPLRPWLLQIVGNEAHNRRRARGRREGLVARAIASFRADAAASPEQLAIVGESRAEVRRALAALRDEERLVVSCRYLMDLSEAETAAALGVPAGTVKSRLHRGLARLRAELELAGRLPEVSP